MDIKETIELDHQPLLSEHFRNLHLKLSDYTFANLYLFRKISSYEIVRKDCGIFISAYNRQGQNYVMPLTDLRVCSLDMIKQLLSGNDFLFPIPEEWLPFFPAQDFRVTYDDGESDYVYLTEKIASFAGRTYHRHRNHLNQFFGLFRPEGLPLEGDKLAPAMDVLDAWQEESRIAREKTDYPQCAEALRKFRELALWGTIYYIDNEPAGFIVGEPLNEDMFCLHFAKASKKYHGIYEFMFNDTARHLQSRYTYLNLEEDMDNGNLRRTKISYRPERILKKYRVCLAGTDAGACNV